MYIEKELTPEQGEQPLGAAETIAKDFPIQNLDADPPEPEKPADGDPAPEADNAATAGDATAEEPEQKPDDKAKAPLDWREKRRIEEVNKRRVAEEKLAEAERRLAAYEKPADTPAKPDAQPISMEEAKRQARAELQQEESAKAFREATGRVLQAGLAQYEDFDAVRQQMVTDFGDQMNARPDFFEAITDPDIPNGHDIFYSLAKDPEQAERILSLPPVKMAIEIAKLSEKLAKPAAAAPKPISKAPAPLKPVGGAAPVGVRLDDESLPMDKWADTYLRQVAAKGR